MQDRAFDDENDLVGNHRHQHQDKQSGEDACGVELATGSQDVPTEATVGSDQFAHDRADQRQSDADPEGSQ
ncbi:MAG: hypothetical protein WBF12_10330, partial [Bradyrhizobium sp.]